MAIPLTINGAVFEYPQNFDEDWGVDATGWAQAVTAGMLSLAGGNFPLTAQVDFGTAFGIKVKSILTETALPSTSGYIALAHSDTIGWRNAGDVGNLLLSVDGSDMLRFNGSVLGLTALTHNDIYVGDVSNNPVAVPLSGDATIVASGALTISSGAITNAKVASGAAIAVNKLAAQTANRALATDASGFQTPSSVTSTELGYLSGVTGPIQTQLATYLPLAGGTMSGAINMASNKIMSVTNGTNSGDAVAFNQVKVFQTVMATSTTTFSATGGYAATNLSANITLSDASHRVLIWAVGSVDQPASEAAKVTLFRGSSTNLLGTAGGWVSNIAGGAHIQAMATLIYIDTPGSGAPLTYAVYIGTSGGTPVSFGSVAGDIQVMILQEIV